MAKIRVAIAGVGNCASSLVQGIEFYRNVRPGEVVPGLMHADLGGYGVGDIDIVAAFDVAVGKVGCDLADAILASPNNTHIFAQVPQSGVTVLRGPTMDGIGQYVREMMQESEAPPVDVAGALRQARAEILISYLPVGI